MEMILSEEVTESNEIPGNGLINRQYWMYGYCAGAGDMILLEISTVEPNSMPAAAGVIKMKAVFFTAFQCYRILSIASIIAPMDPFVSKTSPSTIALGTVNNSIA